MGKLTLITALIVAALLSLLLMTSSRREVERLGPDSKGQERTTVSDGTPELQGLNAHHEARATATTATETPSKATQSAPEPAQVQALNVLLLDESLDVPVIGEIENASGRLLATTGALGEARIPWERSGPGSLTFRAFGFDPLVTTPTTVDLAGQLVVKLSPTGSAEVRVFDRAGAAFADVTVQIITRDRLSETFFQTPQAIDDSAWSQTLLTDEAGSARLRLSCAGIAELTAPNGVRAQAWVRPGRATLVTLDRTPATVQVVDGTTGEAIPDFLATVEETDQPSVRPVLCTSDEEGRIALPSKTNGVLFTVKDPRWASARMESHPTVTPQGSGHAFRFDRVQPTDTFVLEVETCIAALRLVDARTDLPLEGTVTVLHENGHEGRWSASSALRTSARLDDGLVHLSCTYLPKSSRRRLRLKVAGYQDAVLSHTSLADMNEVRTVALEPGERALTIEIAHADGHPAHGYFAVHDHGTGSLCPRRQVDTLGRLELKHWGGSDLSLYSSASSNGPHAVVGTIQAEKIHQGRARFVLPAPSGRGEIVVTGATAGGPPVIACTPYGTRYRAVRDGTTQVATALPEGSYLVGTAGWLDGVLSQNLSGDSLSSQLVQVEPGQQTEVVWDPRWATTKPITGRVIASPARLASLSLRPWYATTEGSVNAYDEVRIGLDASGRYIIPAGEPLPERLLVCPSSDLYWIEVLQSFRPGDNVEVPSGALRIQWDGPLPVEGNLTVFVAATEPVFDAPFTVQRPMGYYREWTGTAPFTSAAVSTFVNHIKLDAPGRKRASFPVEIDPQLEATLTVSLEDFEVEDR